MVTKAPLSAVVVCCNEAKLLGQCLDSLRFCDEIIVVDLGSKDDSVKIAKQRKAKVIGHPWVPIGEMARAAGLKQAKYKWLLIVDPDEAVSEQLADDILEVISQSPNDVGVISVPWLNYVYGKVLKGTVWGGFERRKNLLMHKDRVRLNTRVHSGYFDLKSGYKVFDIPVKNHNFLLHFWLNDYREFLAKHRRYLKLEGEARYIRGERSSYRGIFWSPWRCFKECFLVKKGYRDGLVGFFLSMFWAWYTTDALIRLKREQVKREI